MMANVDRYTLYRDADYRIWLVIVPEKRRVELLPGVTVTIYGDTFLLDEHGRVYFKKFGEIGWHGISFNN